MSRRHLLRSTATVSLLTMASRVLGFVREMLMAYFFGTALAKSAFDVAFKIPNLFRRLFGEGALSAAFIPVFTETLEREGDAAARRLAGRVWCLLSAALLSVTAVGVLLAAVLLPRVGMPPRVAAVLPLLAIMLPYMLFICLVALSMGILNSRGRFAVPAATPIVLNVVWIASLYGLCPLFGETPAARIHGVAWGVLAAGVVQLAVQLPVLRRAGLLPDFRGCRQADARVRRMLGLMAPVAIGAGLHEINVLIDAALALFIGSWAPAALTYAERLIYLPLGVFATALSTVLLPTFSRHVARGDQDALARTFRAAMSGLLLIMLPAAVLALMLAGPVVRLIFERGEFGADSTLLTARALRWYAPGLVAYSLHKVIVPVFHARQDTRTPVRIGIAAIGANIVLNVCFVLTWPAMHRHAGLAFASVLSQGVGGLILGWLLCRRIPGLGGRRLLGLVLRAGAAAAVAGYVAALALAAAERTWTGDGVGVQMWRLTSAAGVGVGVYGAGIMLLCRREVTGLLAARRGGG